MQREVRPFEDQPGPAPVRVGLVGLGVIGTVHRSVLEARSDVRLAFIADPSVTLNHQSGDVPRFRSLGAAVEAHDDIQLVVVATPTDTHLDLASEVLERTRADVLSEKPVSRDSDAVQRFCERHSEDLGRVRTVNHFAFSPEVVWASQVVSRNGWGPPGRILSCFNDPYAVKAPHERRSYVSSWVDSGANQFAILARFCEGWTVTGHEEDADGMRSVTSVDFDGGSALLSTNWWAGASSKQTILRWDGNREVVLDHTSMTGVVLDAGRFREHFGNDGTVDRKTAHYAAMYRALLDGDESYLLDLPLAVQITKLLSQASAKGTPRAGVNWSMAVGT